MEVNLTSSYVGFLSLAVFFFSYALVMAEEFSHLRKSKPVIISAAVIWGIIAFYFAGDKSYAKEIGIDLFATPFDLKSVEFLSELDMPCYKIASADLQNTILQKEVAKLNKPIFLSTGGGTLDDV